MAALIFTPNLYFHLHLHLYRPVGNEKQTNANKKIYAHRPRAVHEAHPKQLKGINPFRTERSVVIVLLVFRMDFDSFFCLFHALFYRFGVWSVFGPIKFCVSGQINYRPYLFLNFSRAEQRNT